MRVKDKVTVITGGANGIGKETACLFAENGAKLVIVDVNEAAGLKLVDDIRKMGTEAEFVLADVSQLADVQKIVDTAIAKFSRIDVLINNAGIVRDGFLTKTDPLMWEKVIAINLTGVFYTAQAVGKVMMEQGHGVILNASSIVGVAGNIGQTNYAATKAGVIGMTKTWAKELGPKGIRVNAVAPGFIATTMTEGIPAKLLTAITEKTPLRRIGQAREVANAYLFLASDEASFINGEVLHVDGGVTI